MNVDSNESTYSSDVTIGKERAVPYIPEFCDANTEIRADLEKQDVTGTLTLLAFSPSTIVR